MVAIPARDRKFCGSADQICRRGRFRRLVPRQDRRHLRRRAQRHLQSVSGLLPRLDRLSDAATGGQCRRAALCTRRPRRWPRTTPRSCATAPLIAAERSNLPIAPFGVLPCGRLGVGRRETRAGAVRRIAPDAVIGARRVVVLGEADHRLHFRQHLVGQPAQALVAVAEILDRRQLRLAEIVRHQLLVAAARLERAAGSAGSSPTECRLRARCAS